MAGHKGLMMTKRAGEDSGLERKGVLGDKTWETRTPETAVGKRPPCSQHLSPSPWLLFTEHLHCIKQCAYISLFKPHKASIMVPTLWINNLGLS